MNRSRKALLLGATAVGAGAALAGLYRATHPADARSIVGPTSGRRPTHPPDDLFDMPDDVVHHHLETPDGGVVHAVERGTGRPVVLLHGVTLRHDVWAPQFHQLADRYRVIAVDLRGHGQSTAGANGYGMSRLGDDLAALLQALDLHHAVVVGHSMGGMTVMQFCGEHPEVLAERVDGIVFLATRAHQVMPPYVDRIARRLFEHGQRRLDAGLELPARRASGDRTVRLAFGDHPSPKAVRITSAMTASMEPDALLGSLSGLIEHDAREALRATRTPSLVVVGTRDILTPVPSASHLAHLLPESELVVLARAGHQLMQERPDEVAALLDEFVAQIERRSEAGA